MTRNTSGQTANQHIHIRLTTYTYTYNTGRFEKNPLSVLSMPSVGDENVKGGGIGGGEGGVVLVRSSAG